MKKTIILIIALLMVTGCSSVKKSTDKEELNLSVPEEISLSKKEESVLDSYIDKLNVDDYLSIYEIDKYKYNDGSCHIHLNYGDMSINIGFENMEFDSIGYMLIGKGQTNNELQEKALKDLIYVFLMLNNDISIEEAEIGLSTFSNDVKAVFYKKDKETYIGKLKFKTDFNYIISMEGTSVSIMKAKA